jgi:hypothetical protein
MQVMEQNQAFAGARHFAKKAYSAEHQRISREYKEKIMARRNELAALGAIRSSVTVVETARMNGEQITALLKAQVGFLLEGCELYEVQLDEQIKIETIKEMMSHREEMLDIAVREYGSDPVCAGILGNQQYRQLLEQHIMGIRRLDRDRNREKETYEKTQRRKYNQHLSRDWA